jgi:FkbM family methyltransferase
MRHLVERYSTDSCSHMACPGDTILCKVLGKYLMWVDASDEGLAPHLVLQGYWEMWVTQALARYTKSNTIALDIGANVGYYTLLLADAVGEGGKVYAFEPNKRLTKLVRKSANINGFRSRVSVSAIALSDHDAASVGFAIPKADPKNAGLAISPEAIRAFEEQHEVVEVISCAQSSVDSLGLANIGTVKIDVEGAEYAVWSGMKKTIERSPEIIIAMEANASRGYNMKQFYEEMLTLFSEVRHIDFDGNIRPLTIEMLASERVGQDWMVFLSNSQLE